MKEIRTVEDVKGIQAEVTEFAESLATDPRPLDWEDTLYNLERDYDLNLGDSMDSPAIKEIQKIIRRVIREARE